MTTTAELITRVAAGDRHAWGLLAERHLGTLRSVAGAVCGGGEEAEDAVQEALLRLRAGAAGFRPRGPDAEADARRWLKRLAANAAIDQLRRARRRRTQELADVPAPADGEADPGPAAAMARALERLAPPARAAVELRFRDGLEGAALAAALGISRVAARVRLHRALALLRRHLAAEGVVAGPALLAVLIPPAPAVEAVPEAAFAQPVPAAAGLAIGGSMLAAAAVLGTVLALAGPAPAAPVPAPPPAAVADAPALAATPPALLAADGVARGTHPVWSADGRLVVYVRALEPAQQAGEIRAIDVVSGADRALGRVPYPDPLPAADAPVGADDEGARGRAACVMQPIAADAGAQVVWLACRDQGLWSWRPADGRLLMHHPAKALSERDRFQPGRVLPGGPDGRIAFVDRRSDQIALADADGATVAWQKVERRQGGFLDAVVWWQGHLLDAQRRMPPRLLWPVPARVAPPAQAPDQPWWDLRSWDRARAAILSVAVEGGERTPLAAPGATAAMAILRDEQGVERWRRPLAFAAIRDRLRAASAGERAAPMRFGSVEPWINEEAGVIAFRHPHAVLRFTLEVRYGFMGHVYGAFARYDAESDRLEPLGDGTWAWNSSGVRHEAGGLPDCAADPQARLVAFRDGGRLLVLR